MTAGHAPSPTGARVKNRFVFLDVFRAVAPVLVIYSHIVTLFLDERGLTSSVVDAINVQVRDPLRLEQNLGHIAVVMFFLVSGFVITHTGIQESHREYGIKRIFRVYPLLIFTVLLTVVLGSLDLEVLTTGQLFVLEPEYVITNMLLVNYFQVPQVILVGVAWTLIIEIIFYGVVFLLLVVLRRRTWLAILIELTAVLVVLLIAREFGDSFFLFAVSVSYLPVVLTGQITWAVWSGRIPLWAGGCFGAAAWLLYVFGDLRDMGRLDDAYSSTFALGFCLFLAFLLLEPRLRPAKPVSYLADRSYSLYLLHGPIAFPILDALGGRVPLFIAVAISVAATVAAAELTFRFVEVPGQRIARRISRRYRLPRVQQAGPPRHATHGSAGRLPRPHRAPLRVPPVPQPRVDRPFDDPVQGFGDNGHGQYRRAHRKLMPYQRYQPVHDNEDTTEMNKVDGVGTPRPPPHPR
ncbi:MAG: acyltransferase family protein [Actinophytocola sp.]|nr:acyltransferase family protein [Actinophytocola sp.]